MLISIIVPVYNVEQYLPRCIDSILRQTFTCWELILVDDGSPDRCPTLCDEYAAKDQRIKVIHKNNGGLSDARNCGLDIASGDYVFFIDSDDFIHPDTLRTMSLLCKEEQADIVQCSYIRGTSDRFPDIKESTRHKTFDNHSIFASTKQQTILCAKLYRRTLWDGIRMPIGKIHEDDYTTWKLYYRSQRIVVIDTPYYYYYKNPHSIMAKEGRRFSPVLIDAYEERIAYFEKQGEKVLATLSRWRFCLPLMYLYLRGTLTKEEERNIQRRLHQNIRLIVCCPQVPSTHRIAFVLSGLCLPLFRMASRIASRAHTICS